MKTSKYLFVAALMLNMQISFAKPIYVISSFFIKDGVLLVAILALVAVFKIGQTLFSRE